VILMMKIPIEMIVEHCLSFMFVICHLSFIHNSFFQSFNNFLESWFGIFKYNFFIKIYIFYVFFSKPSH
jgi:hypothetical protein